MKNIKYKIRIFTFIAACTLGLLLTQSHKATAQVHPDLETLLENLNDNYTSVNSVIPNRYDFTDGETGYYIYSGGSGMYWYGNYISTSLGGYIDYSNNTITTDGYFGGEGKYFTRKYPGLFVLAANLNDVSAFSINGDLNGSGGSVDGAELTSGNYKGFVKRVYNNNTPSVNHLIIVENDPAVSQTYSSSHYSDNHVINSLGNVTRLYYLLYAGNNEYYIDNAATQQIMDAFVALLRTDSIPPNPVSNLVLGEILNSSASVSFTAPSDDDPTEPVNAYDVRLSTSPITSANYSSAPQYEQNLVPSAPGSTETFSLNGLISETQYWLGIKSMDEGQNYSGAVITSFTTGIDPTIEVSVESMEFEVVIGEGTSKSFSISNAVAGASPLSYSINVEAPPINDFHCYVTADSYKVIEVNLHTNQQETIDLSFPVSQVDYARNSDNVWASNTSYDEIAVFSAKDHSIKSELSLNNLFRVCMPKYQDKAYLVMYSNQTSVQIYNTNSITLVNSYALPISGQPDDVEITPDGSKICVVDNNAFYVFDATNGELLNNFNLDYFPANNFIISNDGDYAYCYNPNYGAITKLNLSSGEESYVTISYEVSALSLSPDDQTLFVGYNYGTNITLISTQNMQQINSLNKTESSTTTDLHVSEDGKYLYCLSRYDNNITTFNLTTSQIVSTASVGNNTYSFAFPGGFDDYISVNPAEGLLPANQEHDILVSISSDGLLPGIYNSFLHIQSNDPASPLITIPVVLSAKDILGPDFNIAFFQNHYLSSKLKVLVFAREPLPELPGLSAGSDNVEVEMLDSLHHIYNASYKLSSTQNITFTVSGVDSVGNASSFERVLSSTLALKNTALVANYPNAEVNVNFGSESFINDTYVTIWKEEINGETIYHIGPETMQTDVPATLSISWVGAMKQVATPENLAIYQWDTDTETWVEMPSLINRQGEQVVADIDKLGVYKIGANENTHSLDAPSGNSLAETVQASPNPFSGITTINYQNPEEGQVQISLYDIAGNKISTLLNEYQPEGINTLSLDGKLLENGIYFCRIKTSNGKLTQRLVKIN